MWRALFLVVAAGCAFTVTPGASLGDGPEIDAPRIDAAIDAPFDALFDASIDAAPIDAAIDAPPIDAAIDAPPIDAAIDAAPIDAAIDAPSLSWVVVDTLTVPCSGVAVTSTTVTLPTTMYRFTASGNCIINTSNTSRCDAEYGGYNIVNPPADSAQGVDLGIALNDLTPGPSKLPAWGSYTSSHVYTSMSMGTGAVITAKFHDADYTNNSGSLTLTISAYQ